MAEYDIVIYLTLWVTDGEEELDFLLSANGSLPFVPQEGMRLSPGIEIEDVNWDIKKRRFTIKLEDVRCNVRTFRSYLKADDYIQGICFTFMEPMDEVLQFLDEMTQGDRTERFLAYKIKGSLESLDQFLKQDVRDQLKELYG
jgi:hypothetical protein